MKAYWAQDPTANLAELGTAISGLSEEDAARRLKSTGLNQLDENRAAGILRLILRQYESPLVLILIFGAVVSLLLREWVDSIIILVTILGSTALGFVHEYRASKAVKRLRETLALKTEVLRQGQTRTVDARCLVPGDIVLLAAGDLVPADGVVIEAKDFLVSQAALTGESFPVEKFPAPAKEDATLTERANAVYLGTSVRSGTAKILVIHTGHATELGHIARDVADAVPESDFEHGIRRFGYLLTRIMMAIVVFVFTVNLLLHRPLIDSLLFSVALAVGLSPELLPAILSVTLSAGARRMARRGVIVRRLEAIENLGSTSILCTDKTGTITKGVIELTAAVDCDGKPSDRVFGHAAVNARLETGIANALDKAIVTAAEKRGLLQDAAIKIDEIPYDFMRKRLTIVIKDEDSADVHLMISKGAFDSILASCDRIATPSGPCPLAASTKDNLESYFRLKGSEGFRVLGLATKRLAAQPRYDRSDETGMVFEGFLLFFDDLKEGIGATIRELKDIGIAVKVVTGDNRYVAQHVGAAVGLDPARLLTGKQLREMRNEALWHLAERTDLFAEVDPQQKEQIIRALQHRGHAVTYLGDGINDAPALHAADAGVSVDQAVDVARESADIVLLKHDLGVLKDGIVEGRRTFANTLKYITITMSANFGNMISMALATMFVPFLPLLAKQILLNNFLSDIPSAALAGDNVDPGLIDRPQRWDIRSIQSFMLAFGLISTVFDFLTFAMLLLLFQASEALFQSAWFVVSVLTELAVVLVLRTHLPSWKSRPRRTLVLATLSIALLALLLPYLGPLARGFGFVALPLPLFFASLAIVAGYIAATEAAKRWFYQPAGRPRKRHVSRRAIGRHVS